MGGFSASQPYIYEPSLANQNRQSLVYPYSSFNPRASSQATYSALVAQQQAPKLKQDGPLISFNGANDPSFNPRAVTQMREEQDRQTEDRAVRARKKREGPLINFNQHPDSYEVGMPKKVNYNTMPANTKKKVAGIRWAQFALRLLQAPGAIACLVAVICLQNIETALSWIIRIAPGWDIVISLYAIYHLIRPAKVRTPASSASYHIFALFMDVGLMPFYIFISLFAYQNYGMEPGTKDRWTSMFKDTDTTTTPLFATFIGAAVIAGLHALSAILDLWLIVLFRKIAKLPADLNPLEDNLTSRASRKHKYKNSEVTLTNESMSERKPGYLSGSTLSVDKDDRFSTATKDGERVVPFAHSRGGSGAVYSPHNPQTARMSQQYFENVNLYEQTQSARDSRTEGFTSFGPTTPSKRGSFVENATANELERLDSVRPVVSRTNTATSSPDLPSAMESQALVTSEPQIGLLNDNWFVYHDEEENGLSLKRQQTPAITLDRHDSFEHQPLGMNPPTPPPPSMLKEVEYRPDPESDWEENEPLRQRQQRIALSDRMDNGNGDLNRHLTVQSTATNSSSVYSQDESAPDLRGLHSPSISKPKGRYYGDLAAATRGVRGFKPTDNLKSPVSVKAATPTKTAAGSLSAYTHNPRNYDKDLPGLPEYAPRREARVISRTGVDIVDYAGSIRGRRDVSGKIAEEGRAGGKRGSWWMGMGY